MSLLYGSRYTPFNLRATHAYQPEELIPRMHRIARNGGRMFLEVDGMRLLLAPEDFTMAARVACAHHAGVTGHVSDSDDDYLDSGSEESDGTEIYPEPALIE